MNAVVCHKPPAGRNPITLRAEVLRRMRNGRQKRGSRLKPVLARNGRIRDRQLILRIEFLRAIQRILKCNDRGRRGLPLRLHEL